MGKGWRRKRRESAREVPSNFSAVVAPVVVRDPI